MAVYAAPREMDLALALAAAADRPADWPGLGRRSAPPFRLVVVPDEAGLRRLSRGRAPAWGAAITLPGPRLVLLRADAEPLQTLRHELAHLVLHDVVRSRVPLWFDEGYAVWAAGEWGLSDQLELNLGVATGRVPGLDDLNLELRASPAGVGAAYALAASAVLELARRNPTGTLAPLLARLARGEPFDAAVLATTGLAPDRLDEAWRRAVRRRYGLLTWLLAGGAWAIVALVVVVATRLRHRRDAGRRAALDQGWIVPEDGADGAEAGTATAAEALDPPPPAQ